MATIKDVARETGLGIATISKYLNGGSVREKNRVAIEAAVEKLGYRINEFARGLKTSRSHTVGVVIPELSNLFVTSIITVMEDVLRQSGYGVLICDCRTDTAREAEAVQFLLGKHVDGIINMPVSRGGAHLRPALDAGVPVVLLDRIIPELSGRTGAVLVDNVAASAAAVRLLFDAGHRDIGIILGPEDVFTSQQRLLGYNQVLIQNAVTPNPQFAVFGDYTVEGGHEAMRALLADGRATAVFVTNYEMTLGALIALNEAGVDIPGQMSLIGFDNMQLSGVVRPKLTIVTQPLAEIGRRAAGMVLDALIARQRADGHAPAPEVVTLEPGILPGESVGRVGRAGKG